MPATLTLDEVFNLALDALVACGASKVNAQAVAESIRDAEADGIHNVGLGFLPVYCEHLECGKVDGSARPTWKRTAPGCMQVDVQHGFCHTAFEAVHDDFRQVVAGQGVGVLAFSRSYTAGVLGWFVERLALDGWLAIAFANASPAMAPWGGVKPFFGTNPMAFAAPRTDSAPMVIDQSSTMTAMVNVIDAARQGQPVPDSWLLDAHGKPTTDAVQGLAGSMAPAGAYKGAAIALMVDIMAGGLADASFSHQVSSLIDNIGGPPGVGQLFVAIDPGRFSSDFGMRLEHLFDAMTTEQGVRLPGDRRLQQRAHTREHGVNIEEKLLRKLRACAKS